MDMHDHNLDKPAPQPNHTFSRRTFLRAAAAAAGATTLAACGVTTTAPGASGSAAAGSAAAGSSVAASAPAAGAGGGTTLEWWAFAEPRLVFVRDVLASEAWKSAHPNVTVNFRVFPYDEMHNKLLTSLTAGTGAPDVADVEISRFARFIKGERVPFVALNDRIGDELNNLYTAAATDPWSWQGQIYGLGNELNTVVMTYRKDILDGLGIQTPFATWNDVIAAGKKVTESGKKMFAIHDISFGDWYMLAQSAGTTLFDEEGNYQGDNEKSVAALQFLQDLVHKEQIAGIAPAEAGDEWTPPTYWAAFNGEQFVATFGPPWHLGNLLINVPDQAGKWAVQALPKGLGDGKPTANFGGTGQVITEQSKNADLAFEILKACNLTNAGVLADFRERTAYPAYKPAYEDPALNAPSEYFNGAKIGEVYTQIAPELPAFRQSPVWPEATEALTRDVITPVMQNQTDAKTALTNLRATIDQLKQQTS